MKELIESLEALRDECGWLTLDRQQTEYLIFLLEDVRHGNDLTFSIKDLANSLPDVSKERAV